MALMWNYSMVFRNLGRRLRKPVNRRSFRKRKFRPCPRDSRRNLTYVYSFLDKICFTFSRDLFAVLEQRSVAVSKFLQEFRSQRGHLSSNRATLFLQTVLANMSSILQILAYPKFEINWISRSKVIAKTLTFSQQKVNFLSITFEPVV